MPLLLPLLSSSDADSIFERLPEMSQWLPAAIALLLGLFLGGVLGKRRSGKTGRETAGSLSDREVGNGGVSISKLASQHAQSMSLTAAKAVDRHRLSADLDQAQASAAQHLAECKAARSLAKSLNAQLSEQHEHVTALADAVDTALSKTLAPREKSIAAAKAQTIRLAEALRGGRQWVSSAIERFAGLHRLLDAGEERLWATAEETAGFRQHLEDLKKGARRRSGDHLERLCQRVEEVDEQMRIYHQQLAGCVDSVVTARSDIEPELAHLAKAAVVIDAARKDLASLEAGSNGSSSSAVATATRNLVAAKGHLREVDQRAIEHADEVLERCEWVASEATHGLRDAVARFGECDSADDVSVAMMLSRTWRKLSEVGDRLDSLRELSKSESIGEFPKISSASILGAFVERATLAISAIDRSYGEEAPDPDKIFEKVEVAEESRQPAEAVQPPEVASAKRAPSIAFQASTPPPVRAMQPGDFARSLVDMSAHVSAEPRAVNDVSSAAANFREATADLVRLRDSALVAVTASRGSSLLGPKVHALQAAFENTLLRSESSSQTTSLSTLSPAPGPSVAPRDDLKRLGAASEELLSAVALKKRSSASSSRARDQGIEGGDLSNEREVGQDQDQEAELATTSELDADADAGAGPGETKLSKRPDSAVLFRGNDPTLWGRTVFQGQNRRALAISDLKMVVNWLRLRRLDTGASVLLPTTKDDLELEANEDSPRPYGFHAGGDSYYGARHLGVFDEYVATDVEVRFTYGGWGFGHSNHFSGKVADRQCCGWAGEEIADDTVFEIIVYRRFPELLEGEVVLRE